MSIFDKLRGKKSVASSETKENLINNLIAQVKELADDDLEIFLKGLGVYEEETPETEQEADAESAPTEQAETTEETVELPKEETPTQEGETVAEEQQSGNLPEGETPAEQREDEELPAPSPEQATEPVIEQPAETEAETTDADETAESEDTIKALVARIDALESELKNIREASENGEEEQGYGGLSSKNVLKYADKPMGIGDKARSRDEWREKFING